jgi:hypothetical protein
MKRFISYNSIGQFKEVLAKVKRKAQFVSYNEETKEVVLDSTAKMPIVKAIGTEKIHGTNAAVCYSIPDGFWIQSRKNIITPEKDNAGCAFQTNANKDAWMSIILELSDIHNIDLNNNIISVFYEWSGGNVQPKSAVSGLDKRSIIFQHFKVSPLNPSEEDVAYWLDTKKVERKENNIFNIMNFPIQEIEIDFNNYGSAVNKMIDLIQEIEKSSPVGESFGINGNIGEGYVFTFEYKDELFRFKVKGEKHTKGSGKIKTLKPVDEALENKKIMFVNNVACTESRLQQMYTEIVHSVHNGDEDLVTMKDVGGFLRLVVNDVIKEESNIMAEQGLEPKMINSMISRVACEFFQSKML